MTLTKEEIFARAGLTLPNTEMTKKEHIVLYNKEQYIKIQNKKEQYIPNEIEISSSLTGLTPQEATPLVKRDSRTLDLVSQEREGEPLDSGAGEEEIAEESPIGPHNVKRALIQLFVNNDRSRNLKIRLNLDDDTNVEFIAPLQQNAKKSNFMRATDNFKDIANDFWNSMRKRIKSQYGLLPQLGKFHENTGQRGKSKKIIQVEPGCFAAIWYDAEEKEYRFFCNIYDLIFNDQTLNSEYTTDRQRSTGVRGQYLWINPKFDTRSRPLTYAERKRLGIKANYK